MVVRDIILVVAVLGVMVFGFFVMKRLDKFLDENRKRIEQEEKEKEPSCVMLTTDMTDEAKGVQERNYFLGLTGVPYFLSFHIEEFAAFVL